MRNHSSHGPSTADGCGSQKLWFVNMLYHSSFAAFMSCYDALDDSTFQPFYQPDEQGYT